MLSRGHVRDVGGPAGKHHYFGAGSWTCDHTSREGVTWHSEYDKPLGEPLGPAVLGDDSVWRRKFKLGTNVTYNAVTGSGSIDWAQIDSEWRS